MTGNRFLTTGQIAELLSVHPSTVHRWVVAGDLVPELTVNGTRMFTHTEFDRFVAAHRTKAAGE